MLAVAADRPGAFQRLLETYEVRVKAAVSRSISDRSSVEDLAQEVFLRLFRARHRYEPTARFETFLYRIIYNLCINHTVSSRRRRTWSLDAPGDDGKTAEIRSTDERGERPLERMEQQERAVLLRRTLESLPDNQKRALQLSRFEGLSYDEIAEVMDLSLQAVKSLLWRARENLRQRLDPILGRDADAV